LGKNTPGRVSTCHKGAEVEELSLLSKNAGRLVQWVRKSKDCSWRQVREGMGGKHTGLWQAR